MKIKKKIKKTSVVTLVQSIAGNKAFISVPPSLPPLHPSTTPLGMLYGRKTHKGPPFYIKKRRKELEKHGMGKRC